MADYPSEVYDPRTKENKAGVVYNADKTTVGYAEDITKLDDEVVAIETALGINKAGRTNTVTSSATPTPAGDTTDYFTVTALAVGATFAAPTGTPINGQKLIIRIKDNGTSRSLAYNAIYRALGVTLPTDTTINKTIYLGMIYNSTDSKWDVVAVAEEE